MSTHNRHINITLEHMKRDLQTWLSATKPDRVAEPIVNATKGSAMAILTLQRRIGRSLSEGEQEAHIRRAWSYMKAILGPDRALEITQQAGTITTIAAAAMLEYFDAFGDDEARMKCITQTAFVPSMSANIVEILCEFNGCEGKVYADKVSAIVPMTDGERGHFKQSCATIDFTERSKH